MDIIDEMVDLAKLAFEANPTEAEELIRKIATATENYKISRALSMELARLRASYSLPLKVRTSDLEEADQIFDSHLEELISVIEDMENMIKELKQEKADALALLDGPQDRLSIDIIKNESR